MELFWTHGYYATSIDDLVRATGIGRHGLYGEFGDKRGVFIAAAQVYREAVVSPAFAPVEVPGAGLADVRAYLETQTGLAVARGLPGPGCLMANTMTESGPHDEGFGNLVRCHLIA
jgi:TetR/AcrR family transcriptional repressor of nem operon